jgi:hypothetical protein
MRGRRQHRKSPQTRAIRALQREHLPQSQVMFDHVVGAVLRCRGVETLYDAMASTHRPATADKQSLASDASESYRSSAKC